MTLLTAYPNISGGSPGSFTNVTVTGSTIPTNGLYLPAANTTGIAARSLAAFTFTNPASAVNYFAASGSIATANPSLGPEGSDANISISLYTKGTGVTNFLSNAGTVVQFRVGYTASAANYLQASGGAAGSPAQLSAIGSDTDIDCLLTPKGTGLVRFGAATASVATASTHQIAMKAADGTTYYLLATTVA